MMEDNRLLLYGLWLSKRIALEPSVKDLGWIDRD